MIKADLHLHTNSSHGCDTVADMYASARSRGIEIIGFSEHSPRPLGFDYRREYRDKLTEMLPQYVEQVQMLKSNSDSCQVLLGMEIDWLQGEEEFVRQACSAYDFDYLLGSVHFLGRWGFDDGNAPWLEADREQCFRWYEDYFRAWRDMLSSGLFQIAAHPDLIKIYSLENFHLWLKNPQNLALIGSCLEVLRDSDMAMEISSAGLRKPCHEIYPCEPIMELAADLKLQISFASDAHCVADIGYAFDRLADYAHAFGFDHHVVFNRGQKYCMPF